MIRPRRASTITRDHIRVLGEVKVSMVVPRSPVRADPDVEGIARGEGSKVRGGVDRYAGH